MTPSRDIETLEKQYLKLHLAIKNHPGQLSRYRLNQLKRSYSALNATFQNLNTTLSIMSNDPDFIDALAQNLELRNDYLEDLDKDLHAMLSTLSTSIDRSRRILKAYASTSLNKEHKGRIEELMNSPEGHFFPDLRNYVIHYENVSWGFSRGAIDPNSSDFSEENTYREVSLDSAKLLKWKEWDPESKLLLQSNSKILLRPHLNFYLSLLIPIWDKMIEEVEEIESTENASLDELQSEQKQIGRLLTQNKSNAVIGTTSNGQVVKITPYLSGD